MIVSIIFATIISFTAGSLFGVTCMCLMMAAGNRNKNEEELENEDC